MRKVAGGTDNSGPEYRDSSGRRLVDYPRPSVAVDTAVLTVRPPGGATVATLCVLQVRHEVGVWGLPGTFLRPGERLAEAVTRSLQAKAGVRVEAVEQLHVFDDPARDDRGWVLSVAHTALVAHERLAPTAEGRRDVRLAPVDAPGRLRYDHRDITNRAVTHIRARHLNGPDPYGLLGAEFTLRRLQQLHEAVAGASLQRDTFRRNMEPGLLPTGRHTENQRGRPAELFRRRK